MKKILSVVLLLLTPMLAFSQSVTLPSEVKGAVGAFIQIPATTQDPYVSWLSLDAGLNLFPTDLLKNTKTAVVTSTTVGRYRVAAVSAKDSKPSEFAYVVVIVGDAPPVPPVPPGPTPPIPPTPIPTPASDFEKAVFAAYALETPADKVHIKTLAKLYRAACKQCLEDKLLVKVVDIFNAVSTVRRGTIGEALPKVRTVVNAEFAKALPNATTAVFTDELRNKASQLFDESATTLEKLP